MRTNDRWPVRICYTSACSDYVPKPRGNIASVDLVVSEVVIRYHALPGPNGLYKDSCAPRVPRGTSDHDPLRSKHTRKPQVQWARHIGHSVSRSNACLAVRGPQPVGTRPFGALKGGSEAILDTRREDIVLLGSTRLILSCMGLYSSFRLLQLDPRRFFEGPLSNLPRFAATPASAPCKLCEPILPAGWGHPYWPALIAAHIYAPT